MNFNITKMSEFDDIEQLELKDAAKLRRSDRDKKLTEKAQAILDQNILSKQKKFSDAYTKWKSEAKAARTRLKSCMSSKDLELQLSRIDTVHKIALRHYEELRKLHTPSVDTVQKMDCASQISDDIHQLIMQKVKDIEENKKFNPNIVLFELRDILDKKKNPSIFGDSVTDSELSHTSTLSKISHASSNKTDAVAELAAKRAQLQSLAEIQNRQSKIDRIQSEYEKKTKEERDRLELIKARKEVDNHSSSGLEKMVGAALQDDTQRTVPSQELPANTEFKYNVNAAPFEPKNSASELSKLMDIFREGISLNRLPTPEPIIFNGDPLQFHEWKNTFSALIGSKAISPTDKLYYLRKYTSGNAAKLIEGSFLRSDDTAFDDAWSVRLKKMKKVRLYQRLLYLVTLWKEVTLL